LKTQLDALKDTLKSRTEELEQVRKSGGKASRVLEKALKEIASCVRLPSLSLFLSSRAELTRENLQNDEIERLAAERFSLYRRCKLEDIDLPLEKGSLDDIPIEEVRSLSFLFLLSPF
jgi:structural maintenance of chromosome 1